MEDSNIKELKSNSDNKSKELSKKIESLSKVQSSITNNQSSTNSLSMKDRYQKSWEVLFNKLPQWRKNELTSSQKSGTFGTKRYDEDFIRQVAVLAESDSIL